MTCDDAKNLMTIDILGDLDPADTAALKDHLARCPSCARAFERSAALRKATRPVQEPRLPDWEKSWEVIARESLPSGRTRSRFSLRPAIWASAGAALLAVFVLGYMAGRRILRPVPQPVLFAAAAAETVTPLQTFADAMEPVLTDFLNRGTAAPPRGMLEAREKSIRALLSETRLLKGLAEETRDEPLWNFLDELESVLVSLSNLKPGDRDSADLLDRTIRDRHMRTKLREMSGVKTTL